MQKSNIMTSLDNKLDNSATNSIIAELRTNQRRGKIPEKDKLNDLVKAMTNLKVKKERKLCSVFSLCYLHIIWLFLLLMMSSGRRL